MLPAVRLAPAAGRSRLALRRVRVPAPGRPVGAGRQPGSSTRPGGSATCRLTLPGRANRSNAVVALAVAEVFGVEPAQALPRLRDGRLGGGPVHPAGTAAAARCGCCSPRTRQAGWRRSTCSTRRRARCCWPSTLRCPDGKDTSWLWDVDYRVLRGRPVFVDRRARLDLAVRLEADQVPFDLVDGVDDAVDRVRWDQPGRDRQLHGVPADPGGARAGGKCGQRAARVRAHGAARTRAAASTPAAGLGLPGPAQHVRRPGQPAGAGAPGPAARHRGGAGAGQRGPAGAPAGRHLPARRRRGPAADPGGPAAAGRRRALPRRPSGAR